MMEEIERDRYASKARNLPNLLNGFSWLFVHAMFTKGCDIGHCANGQVHFTVGKTKSHLGLAVQQYSLRLSR